MTRYLRDSIIFLMAGILSSSLAWAQQDPPMMEKGQAGLPLDSPVDRSMCVSDGISMGGYDLISYRVAGGPVLGRSEFSAEHDGFKYYFSNQINLDLFNTDPEEYLPAYSGFCAITLALGRVTCPENTNFIIQDDRLFLFEITGFTNGRTLWNTDPLEFRSRADTNFGKLIIQQ